MGTNAPEENHHDEDYGAPALSGSREADGPVASSSTASFSSVRHDEDSEDGMRGGTFVFLNFFLGGSAQSKFIWKSKSASSSSVLRCERMAHDLSKIS